MQVPVAITAFEVVAHLYVSPHVLYEQRGDFVGEPVVTDAIVHLVVEHLMVDSIGPHYFHCAGLIIDSCSIQTVALLVIRVLVHGS